MSFASAALAAITISALASAAGAPATGPDSGLPVPRYESLKSGDANGRRGPDFAQPALYRYTREGLPMLVVGESGPWRRVRDPDGVETWMHKSLLSARRTVFVAGATPASLVAAPRPNARKTALMAPGLVAELKTCAGPWRRIEARGRVGWAHVSEVWGAPACTR